jgi:hypothetical protein
VRCSDNQKPWAMYSSAFLSGLALPSSVTCILNCSNSCAAPA